MELLGEFFEIKSEEFQEEKEVRYEVRKTARAVVFNREGEIAVLFAPKNSHHFLPGGPVKKDENLEVVLKREVLKKTGYEIKVRPKGVGVIIEYRDSKEILQIAYCYLADVAKKGAAGFIEEKGWRLEWMDLDAVVETLNRETSSDYLNQFIKQRDLLFLKEAKKLISK